MKIRTLMAVRTPKEAGGSPPGPGATPLERTQWGITRPLRLTVVQSWG
ncbi:MAG: hypothetical protein HFI92_03215 [Lachnospiraceae bacterium]|nr:hypothetical protein [Lachnospiraceae bacterium]